MKVEFRDKVVWLDPSHETSHVTEVVEIRGDIILCSNGTTELECTEKELASIHSSYCHSKCGCIDIQSEAWAYANYKEGTDGRVQYLDSGKNWCPECDKTFESDEMITVNDYLEQGSSSVEPECSASEEEREESGVECEFEARGDSWWCITHNCHA